LQGFQRYRYGDSKRGKVAQVTSRSVV